MTPLNVGDAAPDFTTVDQREEAVSLKELSGERLILFFYPKADTPGCTHEACSLRDHYEDLRRRGYRLMGISPDTSAKQSKFKAKYDLPYPLLSDTDLTITKAYGLWAPKTFMGRTYDGLHRTTFLIDEDGRIIHIFRKVKTKQHAAQIIDWLDDHQ